MPLNFTEARLYDADREVVCFVATDPDENDRRIKCEVSRKTLEDYAEVSDGADAVTLFDKHRATIFAAAEIKRMRGYAEGNGSILVTTADLKP